MLLPHAEPAAQPAVATFHLHLLSPAAVKQLAAVGITERPRAGLDLIAQMNAAGIGRGVVLSTAYWFGGGVMPLADGDEYANVRAENDWTIGEAALYRDRLVVFCSVNPLKDYAGSEVTRCAAAGATGAYAIAVHLWNGERLRDLPPHAATRTCFALRDVLPVRRRDARSKDTNWQPSRTYAVPPILEHRVESRRGGDELEEARLLKPRHTARNMQSPRSGR